MLLARTSVATWEIWLYARPDYADPVSACGLFRAADGSSLAAHNTEAIAVRMAARLRIWLHEGVWSENLADNARDRDEVRDLLLLRESLQAQGIDPVTVHVTAKRVDVGHDNTESQVPRGWNPYRAHTGHSVPVPHGETVAVQARRW